MAIGDRIKTLRQSMGMTQKELAEATGLSRTAIHDIETGSSIPKTQNIQRIADALNVSTWALIPGPDTHEVSAFGSFEDYLESIGFTVVHKVLKWHYEEDEADGYIVRTPVEDEFEVIMSKDGCSVSLTEAEFIDLSTKTEDFIEGRFYKKCHEAEM